MGHSGEIQNKIEDLIEGITLENADKTFDVIRKLNLLQRELYEEYIKSMPKTCGIPGEVTKVSL